MSIIVSYVVGRRVSYRGGFWLGIGRQGPSEPVKIVAVFFVVGQNLAKNFKKYKKFTQFDDRKWYNEKRENFCYSSDLVGGVAFKHDFINSHYHPESGRFLSEDPIGFHIGDKNLYRYVLNNPYNLIDSDGLFPKSPSEARDCYTGVIDELIAQRKKGIKKRRKELEYLKKRLRIVEDRNTRNCPIKEDEANNIRMQIRVLEIVINIELKNIERFKKQCARFPFRR